MANKLQEIARELNLSASTISRVVNNKSGVKESTRQEVLKALKKYDYSPNLLARSLKTNQTKIIGVVVPDITEPFFGNVIKGVNEITSREGYAVFFCDSDEDRSKEKRYLGFLKDTRVDGFIVAPVDPKNEVLQGLLRLDIPIAVIDNVFPYVGNYDSVAINNFRAAYDGTNYLIERGHRRIGLIAGKQDEITGVERLQGYLRALDDAGIPVDNALIQLGDFKENSGYEAAGHLLACGGGMTAIFVTSSQMTYGAAKALRDHGLAFRKDIALLGFDITDPHGIMSPGITSVVQPERDIGMSSAKALIDRIEGKSVVTQKIVLDHTIVERESV